MESTLYTADRLPRKPYCSNDKTASNIRSLDAALSCTHVQFNPPQLLFWLVFDIDFGGEVVQADRAVLHHENVLAPPPNIIVINPATGHAHYYYALRTPVARGENARPGALLYAEAVYRGLGALLEADPCYSGLLARNPLHSSHISLTPYAMPYELSELDEYIWDRQAGTAWQRAARAAGGEDNELGRNCTVFNRTRVWAYQWVEEYRETNAGLDAFVAACVRQAEAANQFPGHAAGPLPRNEVTSIGRSVARWGWRHYGRGQGFREAFVRRQAARGRKKGGRKRDELIARVRELATAGLNQREIAAEVSVAQKTVCNWLRRPAVT